jgi:hypothetical protein
MMVEPFILEEGVSFMRIPRLVIAASGLAMAAGASAQPCNPTYDLSIGNPGAATGYVQPMFAWNDGMGEKIYMGGSFTQLGGSSYITSWNPATSTWSPVPGITAVGSFVTSFARFNPGTGEKLIVGGNWAAIDGVPSSRGIAMWDGQNWSATGAGFDIFNQAVWALHVWDDGTGAKLYIGGAFETIGGVPANRIARWDGTTFEALSGGIQTAGSTVFAMTNYNDGSGDALYVGGNFSLVDGNLITRLARWNGAAWSQVGAGVTFASAAQGVAEMHVLDLGSGPRLYITGTQFSAGGQAFANAAAWDGQNWSPIGQPLTGSSIRKMVVLDEGNGPTLYAGAAGANGGGLLGYFVKLNEANNLWETTGVNFDNTVFGVYAHNDTLYLGGSFTSFDDNVSGAQPVNRIISRNICSAPPACYANCDGSTVAPILNVDDFTCFINAFAQAQTLPHNEQITAYANCDGSTTAPALNVDDFTCFINAFAIGCP